MKEQRICTPLGHPSFLNERTADLHAAGSFFVS